MFSLATSVNVAPAASSAVQTFWIARHAWSYMLGPATWPSASTPDCPAMCTIRDPVEIVTFAEPGIGRSPSGSSRSVIIRALLQSEWKVEGVERIDCRDCATKHLSCELDVARVLDAQRARGDDRVRPAEHRGVAVHLPHPVAIGRDTEARELVEVR